jgi:pimeloyl-ACP methyl ester carboxylesterase
MQAVRALLSTLLLSMPTAAQQHVSFPTQDGWTIHADLYGTGDRGVVLAHGGRRTKDDWAPQARILEENGFSVLAFDLRGFGESSSGPPKLLRDEFRRFDVLAALRYMREKGAKTISVVGGSMGGDYAAEASETEPRAIDRLVLLAAGAYTPLTRTKGRKLFILCRDDVMGENKPRLPGIRAQFEKASDPKKLVLLDGSAHAQFIFQTDQGDRLMTEILKFLSDP